METIGREAAAATRALSDDAADAAARANVARLANAHLAVSPSLLRMTQFEDVADILDQANLPGTLDEHPNWRRRAAIALGELAVDERRAGGRNAREPPSLELARIETYGTLFGRGPEYDVAIQSAGFFMPLLLRTSEAKMSRSHRSLSAFFAFLLAAGSLAGSAFGAPPLEGSQAHLSSAALAAKVRVASRLRLNAGSSAATVPLETYLRGLKTLAYSTTAGSTGTLESETFPSLQVPLDVDIYPGMIISGEPTLINGGKTKPIRLSRGSGDVFVDGLNFANPNAAASRTVAAGPENAFHTAVTQAVHSLASQPLVGNQLGERVECEEHRIYSKDDLMYTLQASYSYAFIASVSGSLSGATDHTSNHVLLWCQHEYYTASFVPDARAGVIGGAAYFGNDVTPASASQFMGAGAPPLVVSEVTYGSQLMALFDSEHTADELKAAVHGSVNYGVQSVSVDASGDSKKVLDDSSIEIYAVGGRASAVAPVVASIAKGDGAAALNKYLAQTVNISGSDGNALESGQPLTYAVQDLAGNDVAFKSTVYYSGKNATGAELDHASISFHTNDDDKDHDTNVDMFLEDSTGTNILRATVNDDRHFDDHSDSPAYRFKPINSAPIYAGDLTGGKFKMIVQTNGHDTWKFTGYLTLYFKNGTKTIYTTAPQSVDQNYGQHQYNFGDYFS